MKNSKVCFHCLQATYFKNYPNECERKISLNTHTRTWKYFSYFNDLWIFISNTFLVFPAVISIAGFNKAVLCYAKTRCFTNHWVKVQTHTKKIIKCRQNKLNTEYELKEEAELKIIKWRRIWKCRQLKCTKESKKKRINIRKKEKK